MKLKPIGFLAGLLVFLAILLLPPIPSFVEAAQQSKLPTQLSAMEVAGSMQATLAVLFLIVIWWLTEAVPLAATALLPAVLFPLLKVIGLEGGKVFEFTSKNTLLNYASPVVYLFLGGFLLAGAMQKWRLDRRFTLWFLTRGNLANRPGSILFGMMVVTAFISMWISNTAAAAMMLPLGLGVLSLVQAEPGRSRFGTALMLGIAWAASIGGVGTLIGTPPNGIAVGILNKTFAADPGYHRLTFLDWMKFGVPYVALFLPLSWFILMRLHPAEVGSLSGSKARLQGELATLGPLSRAEKLTMTIFGLAVVLWVSNPFWETLLPGRLFEQLAWVDEYLIGLACGTLLFFVPVNLREGKFLLGWEDTRCVDWGTLVLFGGGIALSEAIFKTGLASWIATSAVGLLGNPSGVVLVFVVVLLMVFLTEVTSNTAVTSMMAPVVISIALKTGSDPATLVVATAIAASMGFMLPVATPPNALVFGTGYVSLKEMVRAGLILDLVGWLFTVFAVLVIAGRVMGVLGV